MTPYGLIFDLDGVLADTEALSAQAWRRMFNQLYNLDVEVAHFRQYIGMGTRSIVENVANAYQAQIQFDHAVETALEHFYALLNQAENLAYPGAVELVRASKAHQSWTTAIATSSPTPKAALTLAKAAIEQSLFDAVVTGDMVQRQKPDPDIYLHAANVLGVPPERCIVVEDAINGIRAAKAAGMRCVAVTHSFELEYLFEADAVVPKTADLTLDRLQSLID